jgi:hypothetical protein
LETVAGAHFFAGNNFSRARNVKPALAGTNREKHVTDGLGKLVDFVAGL